MVNRRNGNGNIHYHYGSLCHYIYHYAYHYHYGVMLIVMVVSSKMAIFDTIAMVMVITITIMPNTGTAPFHMRRRIPRSSRKSCEYHYEVLLGLISLLKIRKCGVVLHALQTRRPTSRLLSTATLLAVLHEIIEREIQEKNGAGWDDRSRKFETWCVSAEPRGAGL